MKFRVLWISLLMLGANIVGLPTVDAGFFSGSSLGSGYIKIGNGPAYYADWAGTSQITPADPSTEIAALNGITGITPKLDTQRYRITQADGVEDGTNQLDYATQRNPDLKNDTHGVNAIISWGNTANFINYASQILFVRDGNHTPYWYAFNLGATVSGDVGAGWNGKNSISLIDFWTSKGQISHAAIYTAGDFVQPPSPLSLAVPEPASIAMWGIGALGMMFAGRKRRQMMMAA